jgi:hypothetical protein
MRNLEAAIAVAAENGLLRLSEPAPEIVSYGTTSIPIADANGNMVYPTASEDAFIQNAPRADVDAYLRATYGKKPAAPNIIPMGEGSIPIGEALRARMVQK